MDVVNLWCSLSSAEERVGRGLAAVGERDHLLPLPIEGGGNVYIIVPLGTPDNNQAL